VTGPTEADIFRTNVGYAKMGMKPKKLQEYKEWFELFGIPEKPDCLDQAALEMLGWATPSS
jgi:hypothetical protein